MKINTKHIGLCLLLGAAMSTNTILITNITR